MLVDHRLKPVSQQFYLNLFAGWSEKGLRKIRKQLDEPETIGAICYEDLDFSSPTFGARAHLPVGSGWTLQQFADAFEGEDVQLGRPLTGSGRPKYPVFGYKIPTAADERHWELTFDRYWRRYQKITPSELGLLGAILVDTNVEMSRYYSQLALLQTEPLTMDRGLASAAS